MAPNWVARLGPRLALGPGQRSLLRGNLPRGSLPCRRTLCRPIQHGPNFGAAFSKRAGQRGHGSSFGTSYSGSGRPKGAWSSFEKTSNKRPPKRCLNKRWGFANQFGLVIRTEAIGSQFQPKFRCCNRCCPKRTDTKTGAPRGSLTRGNFPQN